MTSGQGPLQKIPHPDKADMIGMMSSQNSSDVAIHLQLTNV